MPIDLPPQTPPAFEVQMVRAVGGESRDLPRLFVVAENALQSGQVVNQCVHVEKSSGEFSPASTTVAMLANRGVSLSVKTKGAVVE